MIRFVPVAEYQRISGLSFPTVKHGLETGQLKGIKTEAGHWRVQLDDSGNTDTAAIVQRLDEQGQLLKALAVHLGVR